MRLQEPEHISGPHRASLPRKAAVNELEELSVEYA